MYPASLPAGESHIVDLHQFSEWLSSTPFSLAIQGTTWAIPAIQTVHILGLALVLTSALILALRFIGLGLSAEPLPQLAHRYTRVIWLLLVLLLASGALLIVAEPGRTITNPVFYAKMIMLALAIIATLWLGGAARRHGDRPLGLHKFVAAISVALWVAIIFAGRFIAYFEST